MAAREIEYSELYTEDGDAAVAYFTAAMGFHPVARSESRDLRSVALRQGRVRIVVSSGPAARRFLDEHGDGVVDLALSCDDVRETRDAAVAAGGHVVAESAAGIAVSAFGGVRHTLLPAAEGAGTRLPADRAWTEAGTPAPTDDRITHLDHVAVLLEAGSLADYADYYERGFGLARFSSEYIAFGDQAMDSIVVRSESGGVTFTLIESDKKKQPGQIDAFLDRNNGPGAQHLAFLTEDIVATVHELGDRGVRFLGTPGAYYAMLAERFPELGDEIADLRGASVLADRDEWGYLLQLFTRSPYPRNTLFFELVQRRGSRGFGSSNIKALYEAVERDRTAGA